MFCMYIVLYTTGFAFTLSHTHSYTDGSIRTNLWSSVLLKDTSICLLKGLELNQEFFNHWMTALQSACCTLNINNITYINTALLFIFTQYYKTPNGRKHCRPRISHIVIYCKGD